MSHVKIIAFNGNMGVGKSEAIRTLKQYIEATRPGTQVVLRKFAQPLYDMQEFIYGRIGRDIPVDPKSGEPKDRKLLQILGTEWGRDTVSKTLWVDLWTAEVKRLQAAANSDEVVIVCDDCRFDNEADIVHGVGGTVVKIVSDKTNQRIDVKNVTHASEAGITAVKVDYLIENNYSLAEYKNQLTYLFKKLGL